jgi:sulfhydrogenase subunit alpha
MKKITIDHLPRVEGNGGITAIIDGQVVTEVKFYINEGPRLIERLVIDRTPEEDVSLTPRICAICTVSHKLAAVRAMENALQLKVPAKTNLLRELMHMGEMIESHSLHVYYLALPDYLGFPNAIAMASEYEFEVKIALEMKNFGNHIMKVINGRFVHGENTVIGGFGKWPSRDDLLWIKSRAIQFMPFVLKTVDLFCTLNYPDIPEAETQYVCCLPSDDKFGFWGEEVLVSNGDRIYREDYRHLTNEFVVPHSYARRSRYQGKPYSVGALARINNLGERLEGEAGRMYRKYFNEHWKKNPLYNNAAQALEILYCFERIPRLVDELLKTEDTPDIISYKTKEGQGTGLVEAPRGLLIHHYKIEQGLVKEADIITPTAQNAEDIERYGVIAAQALLDKGEEEAIRHRLDILVRAYDPCISCSVHLAEVRTAEEDNWQKRLQEIKSQNPPLFVGVGNLHRGDDGVGPVLISQLKELGFKAVTPTELAGEDLLKELNPDQSIIFIDAVHAGKNPGAITLIPLLSVLHSSSLSHRFVPFIHNSLNYSQLKNSYVLGIQPKQINNRPQLSLEVRQALQQIIHVLKN